MAEKKNEAQTAQPVAETYDVKEIAENAQHLFGYSSDLATAAFTLAGKKTCTLDEAKRIIKEFAERKVN